MKKTNKKNPPEKQAAQHLANLMGWNVAGFEPERTTQSIQDDQESERILAELFSGKRKVEGLDIERCLAEHPILTYDPNLPYIVIASILREEDPERARLIREIDPDIFNNKFARFLFLRIKELHQENGLSIDRVQNSIDHCGQEVFKHDLNPNNRLALYRLWFMTLATFPTLQQCERALSRLREKQVKLGR